MDRLNSFRETKSFTKNVLSLLTEESYFAFQDYLQDNFQLGDVIPGGGGLRKIRWRVKGKGKTGGVRIIYYLASERGCIYLMAIYAKNEKANLSKAQLSDLAGQVKEWLR